MNPVPRLHETRGMPEPPGNPGRFISPYRDRMQERADVRSPMPQERLTVTDVTVGEQPLTGVAGGMLASALLWLRAWSAEADWSSSSS
jgi:hypothetical protein